MSLPTGDDVPEFDPEIEAAAIAAKRRQERMNKTVLYNADPNCAHDVRSLWSGVQCIKCKGWFCY